MSTRLSAVSGAVLVGAPILAHRITESVPTPADLPVAAQVATVGLFLLLCGAAFLGFIGFVAAMLGDD